MTSIDGDVISQVEEYEILDADERSASLFDPKKIEINLSDIDFEDSEDQDQLALNAKPQNLQAAEYTEDQDNLETSDLRSLQDESASDEEIDREEQLLGLTET
jgi:hypothetical protein